MIKVKITYANLRPTVNASIRKCCNATTVLGRLGLRRRRMGKARR